MVLGWPRGQGMPGVQDPHRIEQDGELYHTQEEEG